MKTGFVYIMGSASGTLYVGVTTSLEQRVWQHKHGTHEGFTKRYRVTKLLYLEEYPRIDDAIAREKQLKAWSREKKLALIRESNTRWNDLAWNWFGEDVTEQTGNP
jgi:putative endonuclease